MLRSSPCHQRGKLGSGKRKSAAAIARRVASKSSGSSVWSVGERTTVRICAATASGPNSFCAARSNTASSTASRCSSSLALAIGSGVPSSSRTPG
eukprot:CAMPEP_0181228210 /NCGR_PEP_ID=MMETSP1096-20121128/33228_1 /TAXON_ID=156174 ORGANISM="Chrysochromulina ericina, Strain CCMP281" /NCGR_SAMPLE_ID=MMETSP1096 /ASSEMBLY_ACC=CAM_ASM_000453 /LENGTH=94 /DNA_ID=CAMNT_0023321723 /DNA_START=60 /DNA_END=344 /DNA_ORIENTATION=+